MQTPSALSLLEVWERGQATTPARRGFMLLAAANPDVNDSELAALPLRSRNAQLLALRVGLFGGELDGTAPCPGCGEAMEIQFVLPGMAELELSGADDVVRETSLGAIRVRYRLPTIGDLLDLPATAVDDATTWLLDRCLLEILDERTGRPLESMSLDVAERVGEDMAAADPYGTMALATVCPTCNTTCTVAVEPINYLWFELDQWAWRLLHDVHELASAYGWSESDVLEISPWRRRAYLALLPT